MNITACAAITARWAPATSQSSGRLPPPPPIPILVAAAWLSWPASNLTNPRTVRRERGTFGARGFAAE
eukprot:8639575-Pyramimonas_sp.AAC.1